MLIVINYPTKPQPDPNSTTFLSRRWICVVSIACSKNLPNTTPLSHITDPVTPGVPWGMINNLWNIDSTIGFNNISVDLQEKRGTGEWRESDHKHQEEEAEKIEQQKHFVYNKWAVVNPILTLFPPLLGLPLLYSHCNLPFLPLLLSHLPHPMILPFSAPDQSQIIIFPQQSLYFILSRLLKIPPKTIYINIRI